MRRRVRLFSVPAAPFVCSLVVRSSETYRPIELRIFGMLPDAIYEPAGAAHNLTCPSCSFDLQICRPAHDFPTTHAALVEMFSNPNDDCSTMADRSSKTLKRESSKRSVHSMKSLLPLKLLSPTLPQPDIWPSTSQDQRSTFGAIPSAQDSSRVKGKINNPLGLRLSLVAPGQSHRDTPIYNEPGSPLPGRAYYSDEDLCINCSSSALDCDDGCEFRDYNDAGNQERENEFDDEVSLQLYPPIPMLIQRSLQGRPMQLMELTIVDDLMLAMHSGAQACPFNAPARHSFQVRPLG